MKILIIEDEMPAYNRLVKMLQNYIPDLELVGHLDSVEKSMHWFQHHASPDLIFMDVQLSDGTAFDFLEKMPVPCPIIFTTAYDEYAIKAFHASSIDYLLKPLKKDALIKALDKLESFKKMFKENDKTELPDFKKRFLIRYGEHIKTIPVAEIAYFYSENKATFAKTFEGHSFAIDQNLDALKNVLNPDAFFRINRQYIISLQSIDDMRTYTKARVVVKLQPSVKEPPVVSSERAADFKLWLAGEL